ncbi:MAG: caspase family protein, partial [Rhizobiaceae bacterium]|nr:caspase family protein [Rhizobiaceae bacterium]
MLRIIVFTFFVFLYSLGTSHSVERIALIVGNSAYTHVSALKNPNNDAELMSTTLESVGFDVTVVSDADLPSFRKALTEFGRKLRNSDAVGLFYYAGHGVQMDGENFLIPVDANVQDETELSWQALRVNDVLRVMRRDSNAVNIVILDACRNNPFPGNTRSNTRGLAQIEAASGSYIAYATAPGDVALDGDSGNSPYTLALASAMSVPGLTIEETFKTARQDVLKSTNGKQIPWEASSITGMFHFTDPDQESIGALQAKLREQQALIASLKQQQEDVASSSVLSTENQASGEACNSLATSKEDRSVLSGESVDYTQLRKHAHDAVAACKRAVEAFPKDDRYKYQLARSYLAMGDKDVDAAHWMRKAAEGYYPVAMNGLGVLLNHGRGVATDNEEAFKWITRAAEKGNVPAMTNLGV